ncbi:molybdopterin molybdotransferase MoeA [Dermabacteraceae bacterium P13088]
MSEQEKDRLASVQQYRETVAQLLRAERKTVRLPLSLAVGATLAQTVTSSVDVPGADNSAMDGYVLCAADVASALRGEAPAPFCVVPNTAETALRVQAPLSATIAAGDAPGKLAPFSAAAIMTGAPVPEGADIVVPVEDSLHGAFQPGAETVELTLPADVLGARGRFIRERGSDVASGAVIGEAGDLLTPARIAHLASCGVREVAVAERLRALVVSTGSEVVSPGAQRGAGMAFDANSAGLAAALSLAGADVVACERVPDSADALLELLETYTGMIDLVVTTGGVSRGAFEVVRHAAARPGVNLQMTRVAMQPGGPQGCGTLTLGGSRVPWVAFPGNPVSALISMEVFLRPALLGAADGQRLHVTARLSLEGEEASPEGKLQWRRGILADDGTVTLEGGPSSHLLAAMARANCLVEIPAETTRLRDGDAVRVRIVR